MKKIKPYKLLPLLFAIALGSILFFQFKSYNSIKQLIGSNEELLNRINYKNQFQLLQTHLATFDKLVREAVITKGAVDEKEIRNEIQLIDSTMDYIDDKQPYEDVNELSESLDSLVNVKIVNGIEILNEYVDSGKQKAELMVYDHNKRNTNEIILKTIRDLESLSEKKVEARVSEIDLNEKNAMQANILIAIGACLFLVLALIYIFYKIMQQQSLIQELNVSREKEAKSAKIKDDFLANMSHEIRTPLNAIVGFTRLLEKEKLSDRAGEFVSTIKTSGAHLMDIVDEILDIAKLEAGMILIEHDVFNLKELIGTIDHSFRERIQDKGISFVTHYFPDDIAHIKGDEYRLTQILNNLLSNALKFTTSGKIILEIRCKERQADKCILEFTVTDTGIGITDEKIKTIFDRFEQGDPNITRKYGGTGLGLSIVKQLIDLQGGQIDVQSNIGKGSSFILELPFECMSKIDKTPLLPQDEKGILIEQTLRILIVEDNRINQQLLEYWFSEKNIRYRIAQNGFEALEILSEQSFDLILMDIQMPEMDGYDVTTRIRQELKNSVPVIAMTAHAMDSEKEKCIACGMNDYLSKPIAEADLFLILEKYAGQKQNEPLADISYLRQLSSGNNLFIIELLGQFLVQAPQELSALKDAFAKQDEFRMKAAAHSMKTTFGYIGMDKTHWQVFEQIEKATSIAEAASYIEIADRLCARAEIDCMEIVDHIQREGNQG